MVSAQEKGENAQFSSLLQEPPGDQVHLSEPGGTCDTKGQRGYGPRVPDPILGFLLIASLKLLVNLDSRGSLVQESLV